MKESPSVVITGGSNGLGFVIAHTFVAAGYRVCLVGRAAERLESAVSELNQIQTGQTIHFCGDVTDLATCQKLANHIGQCFGKLDVLINCVGASDRGFVADLTPTRLRELIDINVCSTLLCSQRLLPLLAESGGSIVNIGSLAGKVGARYLGGYNAAKHALVGLTQQMRLEWREQGVHVALVCPGPIKRADAGTRYGDQQQQGLPQQASAPGGGTKVKGLDPQRVAEAVFKCAQRKRTDVILPGHLRFLIVLGNAFPRLGDWLLLKFTS